MLKFTETDITFKEVPGKICRCFSVSNCGLHCKNCHSPELQGDNGEELTPEKLLNFIKQDMMFNLHQYKLLKYIIKIHYYQNFIIS